MEKFTVQLAMSQFDVYIGGEHIEELIKTIEGKKCLLITDESINEIYGDFIDNTFENCYKYIVPSGERAKSFSEIQKVLKYMISKNFDRNSVIIAFGGGVVGDLSGFCASIYMRGISYYQVPTTLLAQVDSSLGGKTGINFCDIKNVIGSFYQPKAIFVNTHFLKSLPKSEIKCGYGEIVKTALLDKKVHAYMKKHAVIDIENLQELVRLCLEFKARIVKEDEKEGGLRKILNLGHTIGHAFEEINLGGHMRHGEYVLIGLYYELKMSKKLGLIDEKVYKQLIDFISIYKNDIPKIQDIDAFYKKLTMDKKNDSKGVSFILLTDIFKTKEVKLNKKEIYQLLGEINES